VDDLENVIAAPNDTEEKRREQSQVTDLVDRLEKKEKELAPSSRSAGAA